MEESIRFALAIHNHQPVGNFDHVIEDAYRQSYLPFLDVFETYQRLKLSLHVSGPLMEWLDARHPDYIDRLGTLIAAGRLEVIGGAFYEPILSMLPRRDRIGQIAAYSRWLSDRLGAQVRGMWIPERVWEQPMTSDLVNAGIEYTLLDDFHFKNAGLRESQLYGYYVTEDEGKTLAIFPGSERLRYSIPFAEPDQTIDYLRQAAQQTPGSVLVFGDDGEKFGTWPETHQHVYTSGWLRRFFDALVANSDWIQTTTLSEAHDHVPPLGRIYLPDASYREMTEWALPFDRLVEFERLQQEFAHDQRWHELAPFVRGGYWRNFKAKYPESNEMYARMMMVSDRLDRALRKRPDAEGLAQARRDLYRGQCNCAYWHGAFGGVYLPHLRDAVYQYLIAAENRIERVERPAAPWVEATVGDYNFDARQEVRLANDQLVALCAPAQGGMLYELDARKIRHNLLATLARRPEAYHQRVLTGSNNDQEMSSIHDRVVFKQEGLDRELRYDAYPRKALLDHFYSPQTTLREVADGKAEQWGDFLKATFHARLRRDPDRIQLILTRDGNVADCRVNITKSITAQAGHSSLDIAYTLAGLPQDREFRFAVEFGFAGLPAHADDRYFHDGQQQRMGHLGTELDVHDMTRLNLADGWRGLDVGLAFSIPTSVWTHPVATVSQSEGGFELVHQSVVVLPHWMVRGDDDGRWQVGITLDLDTSAAQSRDEDAVAASADS